MSLTINDLSTDLLDLVSRMINPSSVKILRATCSKNVKNNISALVIFQDTRYRAAKKIQKFWNSKRLPDAHDEYWSKFPWALLSDDHRIHWQYKRLLIGQYPIEHIRSMTSQLVRIRGLMLDEERCGSVAYWASLVKTSTNDQISDLGW